MLQSESITNNKRAIDFDLDWYAQSDLFNQQRSKDRVPFATLFTQYDRRFNTHKQVKRHSRLPMPAEFSQQLDGMNVTPPSTSPIRRLNKGRSISDFGSPSSQQVRAAMDLAKQHRQRKALSSRPRQEEVTSTSKVTPLSGGFFDDGRDDNEVEDLGLLEDCQISIAPLAFPMPPRDAIRPPLRQARSMTAMSNKFSQGGVESQEQQRSPLRQRRCKLPLSIKTQQPPLQRLRRRKSSLSSIHSPPPCPPPATPLPEIPLSGAMNSVESSGNHSKIKGSQLSKLDWDWNGPIISEPASASSSSSTSPASSRGSSHHHSDSNSLPLTPPVSTQAPSSLLLNQQPAHLALYFAFHLNLDGKEEQSVLASTNHSSSKDIDSPEDHCNYVYGFAM